MFLWSFSLLVLNYDISISHKNRSSIHQETKCNTVVKIQIDKDLLAKVAMGKFLNFSSL